MNCFTFGFTPTQWRKALENTFYTKSFLSMLGISWKDLKANSFHAWSLKCLRLSFGHCLSTADGSRERTNTITIRNRYQKKILWAHPFCLRFVRSSKSLDCWWCFVTVFWLYGNFGTFIKVNFCYVRSRVIFLPSI